MRELRNRILLGSAVALLVSGLAMTYRSRAAAASPQAAASQQPATESAQASPQPPAAQQTGARGRGPRPSEGAGSTIFGNYCENCHGKLDSAPAPALLKKMTPEHIYEVLTTGVMAPMSQDLTDQQKKDIAEWVGGRKLEFGDIGAASKMPNQCSAKATVADITSLPSWNGWSPGIHDARFQDAKDAGISPEKISDMHLRWAFAMPGADSVYGQPTIVDGKVYVTSDAGYLYSLDANSGCVHWSYSVGIGVRSAPIVGPVTPGSKRYAVFFGDIRGNVYAVDANNGKLIWKDRVDAQPLSRVTGGTVLYDGRLYVPVASLEEPESSSANYQCCQFRGLVASFDAATGEELWKSYMLPDPPSKQTDANGVTHMGPAGVGVWGTVTIDKKRNAMYIGTGNTFSGPDIGRSDAVIAMNLDSGKILWVKQVEPADVWHTGCPQGDGPEGFPPKRAPGTPARAPARAGFSPPKMPPSYYCADPEGPDWDISSGVMFGTRQDGHDILVVGQKSGLVWGLDPDKQGEILWESRNDLARSQIVFGGAMDQDTAYFAFRSGGVDGINIADGKERWYTEVTSPPEMAQHRGFSAAVSVIPGVVFAGGLDGMLRAFNTTDGREVWQFNTAQDFDTVDGIKAHGGSIGSAGPTVAGGMLYVTSGYTGFQGGVPGNVLLAFSEK
ncbi:MAG: PQQ-binding-like beta-propeller repeat protein [Candidatus Acidiferrales bacterium]